MEYHLAADLSPAEGAPPLDDLQQHGAAALLWEWLQRVATVEGPEGVEITPYEHEVEARSTGVVVRLLVEAPALEFAEKGTEALLAEILERTEHLADWRVDRCEVVVTDADLAKAIDDTGEEGSGSVPPAVPREARAEQRRRLLQLGADLRAFEADAFGDVDAEEFALAAGALVHCAAVLTEELFSDILSLEGEEGSDSLGDMALTAEDYGAMFVLHDLPPRYRHHYGAGFAKRFLIASSAVFSRLTDPEWVPPRCTAEALALHLLVERSRELLSGQAGLAEESAREMFAAFTDAAFLDLSHEWLYWKGLDPEEGEALEGEPRDSVREWFRLADDTVAGPHPYLAQDDPRWE